MKKILLVISVVWLVVFTGCAEKEAEPLQICVDVTYANHLYLPDLKKAMDLIIRSRLPEYCAREGVDRPQNISVEYLPSEGIERENTLTRLRTEIMAGGGPDVFLIYCNEKDPLFAEEAIFTMPEKAMELSIFMTLDDYMKNNTHFAEWDRMNQTVLAAGRTWEGQQIIPLCYTIPVSIYRKSDVEHTPSKEITWMDMLKSEDNTLSASAIWTDNTSNLRFGMPFMLRRAPMTEYILGAIADYHEEELLFTEEELKQRITETLDLAERYTMGEFDSAPVHYNTYLGLDFNQPYDVASYEETDENGYNRMYEINNGIKYDEIYTMIPLYSDDGGVTAEITAYAAINRNAKNPDDAFVVLDYLSSYHAQRNELIYQDALYKEYNTGISSLPMYDELMSETQSIYWYSPNNGSFLTDENFAALCAVRDQITHVRFRNALDIQLTQIYRDYHDAIRFGGNPDEVVSAGYRKIQQMLRE